MNPDDNRQKSGSTHGMTDTDTPRAQLDVDRFETATVNANGQIYLGRDLEGVKVHVAIEIVDGEPHIRIEITHEENYWESVAEPTVLAHASCQDELNLTFTSATTVAEKSPEQPD